MGGIPLQAVSNRFPQAGENQVTEVTEVFFDLTQGEEGMETTTSNDSLVFLSPSVGGLLRSFRRDWQTENAQTTC